jgi:hypothetical protein
MLRLLVLLLVLGNAGFFAWSQGWLDGVDGVPPAQAEREPQRLQQQINPNALRLLSPAATSAAIAAADGRAHAIRCLEAGPFETAAVGAAEQTLVGLPPGSWVRVTEERPAVWAVYMGRFADREAQQKKEDALRRLHLPWDEVTSPPEMAPGLSLARFGDRAQADEALVGFIQRGVRTARVVMLVASAPQHRLRVARADTALASRLAQLQSPALGDGFRACDAAR